jgi:hypothetical protein
MSDFLSDDLFHLVGRTSPNDDEANFRTLRAIVESESVMHSDSRRLPPTTITVDLAKSLAAGELVVPTLACFCDIPIASLPFHARKYGRFGLGFDRHFLIPRGARPVMYMPMRSDDRSSAHGDTLLRDIEAIYKGFHKHLLGPMRARNPGRMAKSLGQMPEKEDMAIDEINTVLSLYFLAFLKPYNSQLDVGDPHYYYSEREWRMTGSLRFIPGDVTHIVVAKAFEDQARAAMSKYAGKLICI